MSPKSGEKSMKAVVFEGRQSSSIIERPRPVCGRDEVLLRVAACGVCGGDARSYFLGDRFTGRSRIPGHEAVGIVDEIGADVTDYQEGERLALAADLHCGECAFCRRELYNLCDSLRILGKHIDGGFADYLLLTRDILEHGIIHGIPEGLTTLDATLSEPLCSVLASHDGLEVSAGETVVVLGCGPMGILHLEMLRSRGARVIPVDPVPARSERARVDFGAEECIDSSRQDPVERVRDLTGGPGADVVITAAPSPEAVVQALDLVRKGGRVGVFGGLPSDRAVVPLDVNRIHYGEIRLVGNFSYHPRYHRLALDLLEGGALPCDRLITTYGLEEAERALGDMKAGSVLKAVLLPNDGALLC